MSGWNRKRGGERELVVARHGDGDAIAGLAGLFIAEKIDRSGFHKAARRWARARRLWLTRPSGALPAKMSHR